MRSDFTAQALIRDAAFQLFADHGPDAVSLRQIAERAEVSPALVLHHYGSKAGLREAVDAHAARMFDELLDPANSQELARELLAEGNSGSIAEAFAHNFPVDSPLPTYLRRLLLSGDPAGHRLFQHWYEGTLGMLRMMVDKEWIAGSDDPPVRAAFLLANDLALILLRGPITNAIGVDPLAPEGLARWAAEAATIYGGGMGTYDAAADSPESDDNGNGNQ